MKLYKTIVSVVFLCFTEIDFSAAYAAKKIFVLSDIHVMAASLLDSPDNTAWQEDLANNKKMQDLSIPIFDALVEEIVQEQPDLVLITGDLTKDGEIESHDYVVKKLTEIENSGIPVYVIPGNHDRGWQEGAKKYENNTSSATKYMSESRFRNYYIPFGYGEGSEVHDSSLSYVTEPFPGLTLIGLDSGQNAFVETETINWLKVKALDAKGKGNQVMLMVHHSVIPHFYGQEFFQPYSVIQDEEIDDEQELSFLARTLFETGVKVVLTGHYHVSDITCYHQADQELYDICTGSPLSYPCDYRVLTFDDHFKTLNIVTKSIKELAGYEDFPTYAKERLQTAVYNWALKKLHDYVGDDQTTNQLLAQLIANLFVIHAEGNEPENPASAEATLLFDGIMQLSPFFSDMVAVMVNQLGLSMQSMLGDYPAEYDKDNVVNDRELTITMPVLPTGIQYIDNSRSDEKIWHTLQGVRLPSPPTKPGFYILNGKQKYHIGD